MERRARWIAVLLCILFLTARQAPAEPNLKLEDEFLLFVPGLFGYDRNLGALSQRDIFFDYGVTTRLVQPSMDIQPHDDFPDTKMRVRVTLSDDDPLQNPSGDITVFGTVYERILSNPNLPPSSAPISETLHFVTNGKLITSKFFDRVTSVETDDLGMDATLEVEFWDGHEQEMAVGVTIEDVSDALACTEDWLVYFNGQEAVPDWDSAAGRCRASLLPGAVLRDGLQAPYPAYRGMYFGIDTDGEGDSFFHFNANGHTATTRSWDDWIDTLPYGGYFFDVDPAIDPQVRPIVVQLERQSDLQIVDAARFLLAIAVNPFGQPSLVAKTAETENPGAIAQLTPSGLERLEPTHAATLPYPIVPGGKQPRLSLSAIGLEEHGSPEVTVDMDDLAREDFDYWTSRNPAPRPNEGEFAGYLAYKEMLRAARASHVVFRGLLRGCRALPDPVLASTCETLLRTNHCVDDRPGASNFRIRIDTVHTYFDPRRPDDALGIGDVQNMDLSFGDNQISADFTIEDVQGWLEASIDAESVRIEWDRPAGDPCTIKPRDRMLSDFLAGSADYREWLTCRRLSFAAGSGSLGDPVVFDLVADGELIETPFDSLSPEVSLSNVAADPGSGICDEDWLSPLIEDEILDWKDEVEDTIANELVTSPGQDEALNRLLSPYELGVPYVDDPPAGTPPYDVHPLHFYDLSANIGKTAADAHGAYSDASDGLYVPYLTRSSPVDAEPFPFWFCPVSAGQFCDGLDGIHEPLLPSGLDPDGEPFDVALNYTTAHINQTLWAEARRPDRLGSPDFPARLLIEPSEIVDLAAELGYNDVVEALSAAGSSFGVRYHHEGAPYTLITDGEGDETRLIYATPNLVVELLSIDSSGSETVAAKFLVDVIDRDLSLSFREGGAPSLDAAWGEQAFLSLTSTFLPGCYATQSSRSCDEQLRGVMGRLLRPTLEATLLELIETAPALQLFDSGQESDEPRHLKNPRTFLLSQGVVLVADLCAPSAQDCE